MQNLEENQRRLRFMECKEFHPMSWLLIMERKVLSTNLFDIVMSFYRAALVEVI